MSQRKCIYTGKEAKKTDKVIPKNGGDVDHNWANSVPCSEEYKKIKDLRQPTELEMEANRIFKKLEISRMDVEYYEKQLQEIQAKIVKSIGIKLEIPQDKKPAKTQKATKKQQIEISHAQNEIDSADLKKIIDKNKNKNKRIFY